MGLLGTRWEASYEGHDITVSRNEVTRGYKLEWDGRVLAEKAMSLVGLGDLEGSVELHGRTLPIKVELEMGTGCTITVDGSPVPVEKVG